MHSHTWILSNAALRRYRCDCGAAGHSRPGRRGIVPYLCQFEIDGERKHCGRAATHVGTPRSANRCGEHAA